MKQASQESEEVKASDVDKSADAEESGETAKVRERIFL